MDRLTSPGLDHQPIPQFTVKENLYLLKGLQTPTSFPLRTCPSQLGSQYRPSVIETNVWCTSYAKQAPKCSSKPPLAVAMALSNTMDAPTAIPVR